MACIWPQTTCPHASSAGNGTGLRRHSGDCNPWMVSTCKRIFSPVPSGRRHCLRCRWGPVARPQQTAGSMSPRMHNCHDFLCLRYSVFSITVLSFFFFFFALSEFMVLQCTVLQCTILSRPICFFGCLKMCLLKICLLNKQWKSKTAVFYISRLLCSPWSESVCIWCKYVSFCQQSYILTKEC